MNLYNLMGQGLEKPTSGLNSPLASTSAYDLLCTERPTHWFLTPTIVTRASGVQIILYPDVIETMLGLDLTKTIAEVSREDLTDEQVEMLVYYIHGTSPAYEPVVDDWRSILRYVKLHLDLCQQLRRCGIQQEVLDKNHYYQLGRDFSKSELIRRFWASPKDESTNEYSAVDIVNAIGVENSSRVLLIRLIGQGPLAGAVFDYAKRCSTAIVPLSATCDCSDPIPDGYVLIEVGGDDEPEDEDEKILPAEIDARSRFLVHAPSLWFNWSYIRRMHTVGGIEVETRRMTFPADFPLRLFVLLIHMILNVISPSYTVQCFTPKLIAYVNAHAGAYDIVDGCGEPTREFVSFMSNVKFFDWERNKALFPRARGVALNTAETTSLSTSPSYARLSSIL